MPKWVKVGFSTKDPELRATELNNTGNPHPYEVVYDILVHEPRDVEHYAHSLLTKRGFHENKEWFNCSIDTAVDAIKNAAAGGIILENIQFVSSIPVGKFIVQDGIATHIETGMMWLRFAHGQQWKNGTVEGYIEDVNWHEAIKIPEEFNKKGGYGGFTDWRAPNIEELRTVIAKVNCEEEHCIDADIFPENGWGCSSSWPYTSSSYYTLDVGFFNGYSDFSSYYKGNVRLVRG